MPDKKKQTTQKMANVTELDDFLSYKSAGKWKVVSKRKKQIVF